MKLLATFVATSLLIATASALNLRAGSPEQEQPGAVRNLVKKGLHSVEWELTVQGENGDALVGEVVLCSDPDDPYSNIEMFDFIWIEAEEVASEFFDELAERKGIKRSLLRWHLDSTPHDAPAEFDRRLSISFNYRLGGTCYWCDPDDGDGRRLGESDGHGGRLSDVLARTLKKKITESCKGVNAKRVGFKLVE